MRVLILGASGLVGNILYNELKKYHQVLGTYFSIKLLDLIYLNICDATEVEKIIKDFAPEVIVHLACNCNVDYCEEFAAETYKINVTATKNLISLIKNIKTKFIFFSTDYVFDGKNPPYSEEDKPHPLNEYAKQKLQVENLIKDSLQDFLIIRTAWIYGWEKQGKNFVMRTINNLKNNKAMKVFVDQISTPTYANNLVEILNKLILENKRGLYHLAGSTIISRFNFAEKIAEVFNLNKNLLIPVQSIDFKQKAPRPLNSALSSNKVEKEINVKTISVEEGLNLMKKETP